MTCSGIIARAGGAVLAVAGLAGCHSGSSGDANVKSRSDATPVRYVPPPDRYLKSTLLTFDSQADLAFVEASASSTGSLQIDRDPSDAANRVVAFGTGWSGYIRVSALVRGRPFPGPWDLIGVRYRLEAASGLPPIGLMRIVGGAVTEQHHDDDASTPPGTWMTLWFNLDAGASVASVATQPEPSPAEYRLTCNAAAGTLLVDDVVLAQSKTTACESRVPVSNQAWQVRRRGRAWEVAWGDRVLLREPAAPFADHGFSVVEADPTRVLLQSSEGDTIAVNRLGRLIVNGHVVREPGLAAIGKADGETTPLVEVIGTTANDEGTRDDGNAGRVERTLPGDRDNDGYDETRGCAVVRAAGSRVNARLTSRGGNSGSIRWPVLEVRDLPPGEVYVYVEGQTVPWVTRLSDGRVVVELPITLSDRVDVQVRVR